MRRIFATIALIALTSAHAPAQGIGSGFPASVPHGDTARIVTLPSIGNEPAGAHGFVRPTALGRFEFEDGSRARFVGVTLEWSACLPDSAQAIRMAARFAKLGVNLVRLRYFDNSYPWGGSSSILDVAGGSQSLDPAMMRRFDWFIHQLRIHGVYTYLALQSARAPVASDGYGELADSALWVGGGLYHLYPQGHAALRRHARLLLDHVNPFTGRAYRDEPAIALIELMDRGSIVALWRQGLTNHASGSYGFSFDHSRQLDTLFARYLDSRYGSESALDAAWRVTPPPGGFPNHIVEGSFEGDFAQHWEAAAYDGPSITTILTQSDSVPDGQYALTVRVRNAAGDLYKAYLRQAVRLEYNTLYRLSFRAKSSNPEGRSVYVVAYESSDGGAFAGLQATLRIASHWNDHEAFFLTPAVMRAPVNLFLFFGDVDGELSIDDVELRAVALPGLDAGESLAAATVRRLSPSLERAPPISSQRVEDQSEFMMALDRELFEGLRSYVRDSIGARQPITGAASFWASTMMESSVQRSMDFATVSGSWDWVESTTEGARVRNYSALRSTYAGPLYEISSLAHDRQPLVATFSQPHPNRYLAESMTMLSAYALHQGWDALIFDIWADDRMFDTLEYIGASDWYELAANPIANALLPAISQIFRGGSVAPSSSTIRLQHTRRQIAQIPRFFWAWGRHAAPAYIPGWAPAVNRIVHDSLDASEFTQTGDISFPPTLDDEVTSDTREIRWEHTQGVLSINTPRLQAATGHISRSGGVELDQLEVDVLSGNETATVIWTTLDSTRTLEDAGRSLLVVTSRTEPTGLVWADTANVVGWGTAPMLVDPVRARIALSFAEPVGRLLVTPLDSSGYPVGDALAVASDGSVLIDQTVSRTQWFEVTVDRGSSSQADDASRSSLRVLRYGPDRVVLDVPARESGARLEIFDGLGRVVRALDASARRIDVGDLPSGAYTAVLRARSGTVSTRLTIVR